MIINILKSFLWICFTVLSVLLINFTQCFLLVLDVYSHFVMHILNVLCFLYDDDRFGFLILTVYLSSFCNSSLRFSLITVYLFSISMLPQTLEKRNAIIECNSLENVKHKQIIANISNIVFYLEYPQIYEWLIFN